jgi:hypothetical protein
MDLITVGRLFKQKIDTISDYIDFSTGGVWIEGLWSNPPKKEILTFGRKFAIVFSCDDWISRKGK